MKAEISINGVDYGLRRIRSTGNPGPDVARAAKEMCNQEGIDWQDAEVFALVWRFGEKRAFKKSSGFTQLCAMN